MALIDNLLAYYKLDEASGNALDAHGSLDFTDNNSVGTATGKLNDCRDFTPNDYFSSSANDFNFGNSDFSISLWVQFDVLTGFPVVFARRQIASTNYNPYALFYDSTANRLEWAVGTSSSVSAHVNSAAALSTGVWYHVACWHDAVNNQIGMAVDNGTPVTAGWVNGAGSGTGQVTQIGASVWQSLYLNGRVDELGIWTKVLSSSEITQLYNGGSVLPYPFAAQSPVPLVMQALH